MSDFDFSPPQSKQHRHHPQQQRRRSGVGYHLMNMLEKSSARRLFQEQIPRHRAHQQHLEQPRGGGATRRDSSEAKRGHLIVEDPDRSRDEGDGESVEVSVVAKLMGLDPMPPSPAQPAGPQLQELLRIREPFLLRELIHRDEQEEEEVRAAVAPSFKEKLAQLVKRKAISELATARKGEAPSPLSPMRVSSSSSPARSPCRGKRGLMLEAAVKFVEPKLSSPPPLPSSQQREVIGQNRKRFFRSSSEPTMQIGSGKKGLAKLSENIARRFSSSSGSKQQQQQQRRQQERRARTGLVRSKSDLGVCSSSASTSSSSTAKIGEAKNRQQDSLIKEAMKNIFGRSRKQLKEKKVEPSSSLVRSLLKRRTDNNHHRQQQQRQQQQQQVKALSATSTTKLTTSTSKQDNGVDVPTKNKLQSVVNANNEVFEGQSPPSQHCETKSSGQPSPVSVLEAPFADESQTPLDSSSSSGDDSPEAKTRQGKVDGACVQSDSIISAILDISRIRRIDLSSIGILDLEKPRDEEQQQLAYVEEVLSTSREACGGDWLFEGLPIAQQHRKSGGLLAGCIDDAIQARFCGIRRPWPSTIQQQKLRISPTSAIARELHEQICEWRSMASRSTDELVERDMSVGAGRWCEWSEEVDEIGREVERSILHAMVDELALELFKREEYLSDIR